jgi:hypothetical protein
MGRSLMNTQRNGALKTGFSSKKPLLFMLVYAGITGKKQHDCCSPTYVLHECNPHNFLLFPQPKLVFREKRLMTLLQSKKSHI